jgi:hypothetical protein
MVQGTFAVNGIETPLNRAGEEQSGFQAALDLLGIFCSDDISR